MVHLLLFLLFLSTTINTIADDAAVMLKLANSIHPLPPSWSATSSAAFCSWEGVECDVSKRVTSITLDRKGLFGTLPPELSTLTGLQAVYFQSNKLSGAFPSFSNSRKLRILYLDTNNFTSIPPGFFQGLTSLQVLSIGNNINLAPWQLPVDLGAATTLTNIDSPQCNLHGPIPDIFGSMSSLQSLKLSYNNLSGPLPPSLTNSGIQNLLLNNQEVGLTGSIRVLSTMTLLSQVWLQKNQFTGPIPDLSNCKGIFDLQLRNNLLTGVVPPSLVSLPHLVNVSLTNNKLQGPIPVFPPSVTTVVDGVNNYCTPSGPCDPLVNKLLEIAGGFQYPLTLSEDWKGNNPFEGWPFISFDPQKKSVISINLAKQQFGGQISPAFADLTSLTVVNLSENKLTGRIPEVLTKMPNLQVLDVSNNNLSGKIPVFQSSVKFITKPGNVFLGTNIDTATGGTYSSGLSGGAIAGIIISIIILIAIVAIVLMFTKNKKHIDYYSKIDKKENVKALVKNEVVSGYSGYSGAFSDFQNQYSGALSDGNATMTIEALRLATNNFSASNILGRGGFGIVYKGELDNGTKIAVKRMESNTMGTKGLNEFLAEIAVLTKVRHRHLVGLLGYCMNGNERLLVYEFMPQGTLGQHLFEWQELKFYPLTWKQRATIALDVARGVEYLHSLAQQSFIHRDLKPNNILLGDDMRAKVADFGLVKNAPDGKYSVETKLAGTFGYLAPEYAATGRVTTKVDVFAFGVVLMEMITGRKALDDSLPDEQAHLVTWFRKALHNESILNSIDKNLKPDEETLESIYRVAELARHCTAREPHQRPDMGHAVNVLAPLVEQWRPSKQDVDDDDEEENIGNNLPMSLTQALENWKATERESVLIDDYSLASASISTKPKQ